MKLKRHFFPLLATLIVLSVAGGYLSSRGDGAIHAALSGEFERGLLRQRDRARVWQSPQANATLTLGSNGKVQLFGPLQLKVDAQEALYVLDLGDLKIKKFSSQGEFVVAYGKGRGQGPGEMASLTDFAVSPRGEVWVADLSNGRITVFTPGGDVARTLKLEQSPYRLAFGKNGFFLMMAPVGDRLFADFDWDARLRRSFGTFLDNQSRNAMVLDGWLTPADDGGFIYAGYYDGLMAAYDAEGKPRFLAEVLGRPPIPKLVQDGGKTWVDRDAPIVLHAMSSTPQRIHLLSTVTTALRKTGALDTYDARDGRYLYSLRVPERCRGAVVSPRYLYTYDDTHVTRWKTDSGGA